MNWEQIDKFHQRTKVIGGWLVKAYESVSHVGFENGYRNAFEDGFDWRVAMTFVPVEKHEWVIEEAE